MHPSGRAVSVWTAEFVDPDLEHEFLHHRLGATAQRVRTTAVLGAASVLAFAVSDFTRLGSGRSFGVLLVLRVTLFLATVVFAEAVRRDPRKALAWQVVTGIEIGVMSVLFMVMALRPDQAEINHLGISITIVASFLLVPNRFPAVFAVSTVAVVADVVVNALAFGHNGGQQVAAAFTLVSFLMIAALSANQLQRARREEFLSLVEQRRANDQLTGEITRRRVLEDELTWMATHDPLTDLLNRRAFYEHAEREAARARRTNLPLSILVIDADEFKAVNDSFGHQAGDEALRRIATICKVHLRTNDIVGRIGGEEFAALMPGADAALARHVAERLREAICGAPVEHPDGTIDLSVSIGVTEYRPWQETVIDGIARADEAMYRAKASGRNCVVPV